MTILYVNKTGDNGNDGLSREAAKATIIGAITAASDGDTIYVGEGTYTGQSNITDAIAGGKSLVVAADPTNADPVLLDASGTSYTILTNNEASTGHIEFQDLAIDIGTSSRNYPVYVLGGLSLSFTRCVLGSGARQCIGAIAGTGSTTRTIRLTDCIWEMKETSRQVVNMVDGNLYVTRGSGNVVDRTYGLFSIGGALGRVEIDGVQSDMATNVLTNVTLTAMTTGHIVIKNCDVKLLRTQVFAAASGRYDSLIMENNSFTGDTSYATQAAAIYDAGLSGDAPDFIRIVGNVCRDFANGIQLDVITSIFVAENDIVIVRDLGESAGTCLQFGIDNWGTVDPENQVLSDLARTCICRNNRIECTGDGNRHAAFVGMAYAGMTFENNVLMNNQPNAAFGLVIKGQGISCRGNIVDVYANALYLAGAVGCTVANNTITSRSGFVMGFNATGRDPKHNAVFNNILDQGAAGVRVIDFQALDSTFGNWIDYNIASEERIRFNNTTYSSVAALLAAEENYTRVDGSAMHEHMLWSATGLSYVYRGAGDSRSFGMPDALAGRGFVGAIIPRQEMTPYL